MPDTADQSFTISDLAREFNVTTRTIRFYEDQGLLNPERQGRNRIYNRRDRTRLKLTLRGKRLGLSLNEIRQIIDLFDNPRGEEKQLRQFIKVLDEHRAALEQQKRDLEAVLSEIESARADCLQRLAAKN
jgi:DNA-binding transcriptional MerR regulator